MKKIYAVSACLCGDNCKYNGGNNYCEEVMDFLKDKEYVKVCPERDTFAPREMAEVQPDGRVVTISGRDVTGAFKSGAEREFEKLAKLREEGCEIEGYILKANSPSCGVGHIYDGTFSHTVVDADGVFASMVHCAGGPQILNEKDFKAGRGFDNTDAQEGSESTLLKQRRD